MAARICVMGAGAVGAWFGSALQRAGHDVALVARGRNLEAIRERGLRVTGARGEAELHLRVTDDPGEVGDPDLVLLTVKTYDLEEAARSAQDLSGTVVTLQNGVDAADRARSVLGDRVLAGTTGIVADLPSPGHVHLISNYARIQLGEPDGGKSERAHQAAAWLREGSHIDVRVSEDIRVALWEKMALICGFAGLTTLCRAPIGALLHDRYGQDTFRRIIEECEAVARDCGVDLPHDFVNERMGYAASIDPSATSSMLRDFIRGRRVELDHLNGKIVELGLGRKIRVPVNETVYAALRIASAYRGNEIL